MSHVVTTTAEGFEVGLGLIGLVLLWRYVVSPKARLQRAPSPLPAWTDLPSEFLLFIFAVMLVSFLAALGVNSLLKSTGIKGDAATILAGAGAQFGMLAGVGLFALRSPSFRAHIPRGLGYVVGSGAITFLISWPILVATSKVWKLLLDQFGLPDERQDLIRMFIETKAPRRVVALVLLATVIAPVTEELVFRAGIFRYLRTRAPRGLALLLPSLIFASLHVNWRTLEGFASFAPLLVLALLFSLAYERTGNIATTMVAHALFNLNTIVLIFCGVGS